MDEYDMEPRRRFPLDASNETHETPEDSPTRARKKPKVSGSTPPAPSPPPDFMRGALPYIAMGLMFLALYLIASGTVDFGMKDLAQSNVKQSQGLKPYGSFDNSKPLQSIPSGLKKFTKKELARYDGSTEDKLIYLSILGRVYDVSKGRKHYAPGGPYAFFAGRDASASFATGCFSTTDPCWKKQGPGLKGLTPKQVEEVQSWAKFYDNSGKYKLVGTLKDWDK